MGVRIYLLAKELDMSSKDLIAFLHTQGHRPASHMANVDDTVAQILRDRLKPKIQREKAAREKLAQAAAAAERAAQQAKNPPGTPAGGLGREPAAGRPARAGGPGIAESPRGGGVAAQAGRGATGAPAAREAGAPARWDETDSTGEKRAKERDKEKEKEAPKVRRFFPSPEDMYDTGPRFGGVRRKLFTKPKRPREHSEDGTVAVSERPEKVEVTLPITIRELSSLTGIKAKEMITTLWKQGHKLNINQALNEEMVTAICVEHGVDASFRKTREEGIDETLKGIEDLPSKPEDLQPRAPVVTFLGHVDHGKTSLLDKIRETNVTAKEAGGITQHIAAYRVDKEKVHVVFIDTPGHHAFTQMRARGANVTDVAVLVVAADDGVMPQTEEALSHARAAKVPIVVAINKIDKPSANAMRCKQQLATLNLQPVEWGGDTEFVEVSALTSQGIDTLLETLSLTSEILDLKANPARPALGVVLEAESSPGRGVVATVLVRDGTLRLGDCVLCGLGYGRVRGLWQNGVERVTEAGPSTPVAVTGLDVVPLAGEKLYVLKDLEQARTIAEDRRQRRHVGGRTPPQDPWSTSVPEVRVILKADVQGTLEALKSSLSTLGTEEVKLKLLHAQVGGVNHGDIMLADANGATVFAFNVGADEQARSLAEERGIEIRRYDIIYRLIDDARALLQGQLAPQLQEEVHGHAEIRQLYKASKVGTIAGCMVTDGFIARSDQVRLQREGRVIHTGTLHSLKRFKDDAREVKSGFDCGLKIADYEDIKVGDVVEAFAMVEKPRQL